MNPDYDPFSPYCRNLNVFSGGVHWNGSHLWLDGGFDTDWQRVPLAPDYWAYGDKDGDYCKTIKDGVEVDYSINADVFQSF